MSVANIESLKFSLSDFETAGEIIYKHLLPTPQISWSLVNERCGCEVWIKHENHLPTGSFKIRGGLWYIENLTRENKDVKGVIAATRGNHGQSVSYASGLKGLKREIIIPYGNSSEKNRAMRGYGAELVEHSDNFTAAYEYAQQRASERGLHLFPSFHPLLVQGVGTYSVEFLKAVSSLDIVYVPIGLGSGICGMVAARDALNLKTEVVGVVAENAPAYAMSFKSGKMERTESSNTIADGTAVCAPDPLALQFILQGAARIVEVPEKEILDAIRFIYMDTHNVAEGAGAIGLAAILKEKVTVKGKKVGFILSGGNIDKELFIRAIQSG